MLRENDTTGVSKFLSLVLRHKPEKIGLHVDENGWSDVEELIAKMNEHHFTINKVILEEIVATNNKQRFAFNNDKSKIRANQGHSINVDLALKEANPPEYLYHGTGEKSVPSIMKTGLQKRERHHVHLSCDVTTAVTVGKRYGKPKVLMIAAQKMRQDGFSFYLSANNVWLTNNVPVAYLQIVE